MSRAGQSFEAVCIIVKLFIDVSFQVVNFAVDVLVKQCDIGVEQFYIAVECL